MTIDSERIKAIKKSIAHWENDILNLLLDGESIIEIRETLKWQNSKEEVPCYSCNCELCQKYLRENVAGCPDCPYDQRYNSPCYRGGEAWMNFRNEPNIDTTQEMIRKLKNLLCF